ncbi:MAG: branched-chain amino acid ABC transporter permease, partial [Paracoccaceae bacterium]|nr:branched-chain amino acid ABC transporter permease [Paracoccaceae bacterium]
MNLKNLGLFGFVLALFVITGMTQSWNLTLSILNMALISAIMALGVNLQWGYAGLFNVGVMGFVALGGLAVVLTSSAPIPEAWRAGGYGVIAALVMGAATIGAAVVIYQRMARGRSRTLAMLVVLIGGFFVYRWLLDPAVSAVEAINP